MQEIASVFRESGGLHVSMTPFFLGGDGCLKAPKGGGRDGWLTGGVFHDHGGGALFAVKKVDVDKGAQGGGGVECSA